MKHPWLWGVIGLNLVVLLVLTFVYPHLMVSPGAVIPGHQEVGADCFACHAPLRGAAADRCATCHKVADIGLRTSKGVAIAGKKLKASFHQDLVEKNCMACHTDHVGPLLTHKSRKPFSHALLTATVRDQCQTCHKGPDDSLHKNLTGSCASCHQQKAWKPATFDHNKYFVLDKDHNAKCATCHVKENFKQFTCYGCHEHTVANIRAEHEGEGIGDFANCVECHRNAHDEPKGDRKGKGRGD